MTTATHPGGAAQTFTLEQVGDSISSLAPVVTIPDVMLCRVGTHNTGAGPATITLEDLHAMAAAQADPDVDHAALHPGHFDPRFAAHADGEPAWGWIENARVVGEELRGDLVSVPAKLAAVIPHAYRRRSVEVARNVLTRTRQHAATLTGLALLGVSTPAVKGMEDVLSRYSAAPTASGLGAYVVDDTPPATPALPPPPAPGGMMGDATHQATATTTDQRGGPTVAQLSNETVQALMTQAGARTREELLTMLLQPAATAPAAPAPAAPAPTTPPAAAPAGAVTPAATPGGAPAVPAQAPPAHQGGASPDLLALLRSAGVIPAEGTPAPAAPPAAPAAPAAGAAPAVPAQAAPAPAAPPAPPAPAVLPELPQLVAASAGAAAQPAVVQMSAGTLELLQGIAQRQVTRERADVITHALSAGKFTPAEAPAWAAALEKSPEAITALIGSMAGTAVPTVQFGSVGGVPAGQGEAVDRAFDAADAQLFGGAVPPVYATPTTTTGA